MRPSGTGWQSCPRPSSARVARAFSRARSSLRKSGRWESWKTCGGPCRASSVLFRRCDNKKAAPTSPAATKETMKDIVLMRSREKKTKPTTMGVSNAMRRTMGLLMRTLPPNSQVTPRSEMPLVARSWCDLSLISLLAGTSCNFPRNHNGAYPRTASDFDGNPERRPPARQVLRFQQKRAVPEAGVPGCCGSNCGFGSMILSGGSNEWCFFDKKSGGVRTTLI